MALMNNFAPKKLAKFLSRMDPRPAGGLLVGQVANLRPIGNRPVSVERTACSSRVSVASEVESQAPKIKASLHFQLDTEESLGPPTCRNANPWLGASTRSHQENQHDISRSIRSQQYSFGLTTEAGKQRTRLSAYKPRIGEAGRR
jgi:hypothetical protein